MNCSDIVLVYYITNVTCDALVLTVLYIPIFKKYINIKCPSLSLNLLRGHHANSLFQKEKKNIPNKKIIHYSNIWCIIVSILYYFSQFPKTLTSLYSQTDLMAAFYCTWMPLSILDLMAASCTASYPYLFFIYHVMLKSNFNPF